MAYTRRELADLSELLGEMSELVTTVLNEGSDDEELMAKVTKSEPRFWWTYFGGTKATGALRRKSMELTRALAELRKP